MKSSCSNRKKNQFRPLNYQHFGRSMCMISANECDICSKAKDTKRVIPSNSDHVHQHKIVSFNHNQWLFGVPTLCIFSKDMVKETKLILDIVRLNGYTDRTILSLINKRNRTLQRQMISKLTEEQQLKMGIPLEFNQFPFR